MKDKSKLFQSTIKTTINKLPVGQQPLAINFFEQFFADVDWEDFRYKSAEDVSKLVKTVWQLFYQRKVGKPSIAVVNLGCVASNWQCANTSIIIVIDDAPFVMDSLQMELNRLNMKINLFLGHGGMLIKRNNNGCVLSVNSGGSKDKKAYLIEGAIYIEIDEQTDVSKLNLIENNLEEVLNEIVLIKKDWQSIREKMLMVIQSIKEAKVCIEQKEVAETEAFLQWLLDGNFVFLGYGRYDIGLLKNKYVLKKDINTSLGVLKGKKTNNISKYYAELPEKALKFVFSNYPLVLSKTDTFSRIYRPTYTDSIIVKCYDKNGKIIGGHRFIGLYTNKLYSNNLQDVPLLRGKVQRIIDKFGYPANDYHSRALFHILASLPREDFLHADADEIYQIALGIFKLQGRRITRLFAYEELYGRYISCLVYMPRENYHTDVRKRIQEFLIKSFDGSASTFDVSFLESVLMRVHFVIRLNQKKRPQYDIHRIEQEVIKISASWSDDLRDHLYSQCGKEIGNSLCDTYLSAFPAGYREVFSAGHAVSDIEKIEKLDLHNDLNMQFYHLPELPNDIVQLKLFHLNSNMELSNTLPILENIGFKVLSEQAYKITLPDKVVWVNDFNMEVKQNSKLNVDEVRSLFKDIFIKVWQEEISNDGFNRLTLTSMLNWREIFLLRAYARYLRQIRFPFEQQYLEIVLNTYHDIAKLLVDFFKTKFNPKQQENAAASLKKLRSVFDNKLKGVQSLGEERVLLQFMSVIEATVRTNYYQDKDYISFKVRCADVAALPLPQPLFEIFTYASRFEGIHLRMANVARGGLRWSDRREDFRTEILGLMKAQQVKNVVIIPYGAKGGFVLKKTGPAWDREQLQAEAIFCYKKFISSLLDITDNIEAKKIVRPKNTVCYDEPDPYLVVAADKGTASFSDIANSISKQYDFWLKDAFASGGATGYDHKKIGITAKGAWESVKYNFCELGINIENTDFTVIGIGDMSGDVFGNGMLLSKRIKLLGAFNHAHIFLDPNPEPARSYKERMRLFNLPQSSWEDYDSRVISRGGGVYKRSLKSIKLSAEIRKLLDITKEDVTPNELISALLRAKVDLLWSGGIGTYIKAGSESHADVGDRSNDAVRINANELRCKMVAEGGNLGLTQLGRIEYSLLGGIVNTDFIDNSGGVDCSDHEVNIKILLNELMGSGKLTERARNKLLAKMTNDVSELVLFNNYRQVRAISLAVAESQKSIDGFIGYLNYQEASGRVNRELEFLPSHKVLLERKEHAQGLTRPEIAIILAYSKIIVKEEILHSDLPHDESCLKYLQKEFPPLLTRMFANAMYKHKLRNEIISTQLGNEFITNTDVTFFYEVQNDFGISLANIIKAYVIANELFVFAKHLVALESLGFCVQNSLRKKVVLKIRKSMEDVIKWLLFNVNFTSSINEIITQFKDKISFVKHNFKTLLSDKEAKSAHAKMQELMQDGVPMELAVYITNLDVEFEAMKIVKMSLDNKQPILNVAKVHFALQDYLDLSALRLRIDAFAAANPSSTASCVTLKNGLSVQYCILVDEVLRITKTISMGAIGDELLRKWVSQRGEFLRRWSKIITQIKLDANIGFDLLYLAVHELESITARICVDK